jgi:hypothetical protein
VSGDNPLFFLSLWIYARMQVLAAASLSQSIPWGNVALERMQGLWELRTSMKILSTMLSWIE